MALNHLDIMRIRHRLTSGHYDRPEVDRTVTDRVIEELEAHDAWAGFHGPCDNPDNDWMTKEVGT